MKKLLLLGFMVLLAITAMPVGASAFLGQIHVVVDGAPLKGGAIVKNNVTFVPFRELFDSLGLQINYDSKKKQVTGTSSSLKVTFTIGSKTAYVNGNKQALQAAPFTYEGSVYVPLRIVGESTGSDVIFVKDVQVVLVNSPNFEGFTFDGTFGIVNITSDGSLKVENLLALDEFLNLTEMEEVIVYEKELSSDDAPKPHTSLTPDSVIVPVETPEMDDLDTKIIPTE